VAAVWNLIRIIASDDTRRWAEAYRELSPPWFRAWRAVTPRWLFSFFAAVWTRTGMVDCFCWSSAPWYHRSLESKSLPPYSIPLFIKSSARIEGIPPIANCASVTNLQTEKGMGKPGYCCMNRPVPGPKIIKRWAANWDYILSKEVYWNAKDCMKRQPGVARRVLRPCMRSSTGGVLGGKTDRLPMSGTGEPPQQTNQPRLARSAGA